ncbi:hypothetical protein K432DRAFT_235977 [Lepidopterella palustris CBS 459.81]|uniref:Uncharacterized protein n=1 Tax=Lepidopterella palustris CBS 459.81 TaxID=1314670 RepID=A0A8E2EDM4_9PEZI|nr:hypothetical protein K432DRAFT_235977 [Lepidopterella palustris CBS 459.81]
MTVPTSEGFNPLSDASPSHGRNMRRTDSGFDQFDSWKPQSRAGRPPLLNGDNSSPVYGRSKSMAASTNKAHRCPFTNVPLSKTMTETTPSGNQRRSSGSRRESIGSSSESSTSKDQRSRPSSKKSARRASTSRPAPPYRLRSSQSIPVPSRDIDDVLAFHYRSCSLFQNTSPADAPESYISTSGVVDLTSRSPQLDSPPSMTPPSTVVGSPASFGMNRSPNDSEHDQSRPQVPNTIIHWTSPSTRRREYAEIDSSRKGIRGFFRKVTPKCLSGSPSQPFYDSKNTSDVGSVRRYRLDLPNEPEEEVDEKSTASLNSKPHAPGSHRGWSCF